MELGLRGKAVVVTGGSKGIGLACAQAFLDEGARVALVSRDPARVDAALKRVRAADGAAWGAHQRHQSRRHHDRARAGAVAARGQSARPHRAGGAGAGAARVPMRRYAAAEDVAHLAVFLASDKAGYITGAIVPMDGGSNPVL